MSWKFAPFIVILFFTLMVSIIRYFMIPEWPNSLHIIVSIGQFIMLTAFWFIIWGLGNFLQRKGISFHEKFSKRFFLQTFLSLAITVPMMLLAYHLTKPYLPGFASKQFITLAFTLLVIIVVLLNIGLSTDYFFREWQKSVEEKARLQVETAQLEKEKSMMQYHHLKNQVNPHFLFNTFTSLDGLIQTNPDLASEFVRHLAKVFRYVLQKKENEVVTVQEEVEFIQHYISLLQLRYKNVLKINIDVSPEAMDRNIVTVTLQMLIDNAIKHNALQEKTPLKISIKDEGEYLSVLNNKQLRKQIETSNNQGLQQLKELYAFLTDKPVVVINTEHYFDIKLPLL
ncbi:MAG: histidine kinase [Ferruginibacter sp.]